MSHTSVLVVQETNDKTTDQNNVFKQNRTLTVLPSVTLNTSPPRLPLQGCELLIRQLPKWSRKNKNTAGGVRVDPLALAFSLSAHRHS
jgi:hypothetical protein